MSNYLFIATSQELEFRVCELQRTASPRSKVTKLSKVVRLGDASSHTIAALTEDGRLYTSDTLRHSRTVLPGQRDYDDWMVALHRLGKIDEVTMQRELAVHKTELENRSAKVAVECLLYDAEKLGVALDWNSYAAACKKVGLPVYVPIGHKLNSRGKIVKDTTPAVQIPAQDEGSSL